VDTPFPFPWAQAIDIVMVAYTIGTPIVVACHTTLVVTACLITFCAVAAIITLNEVRIHARNLLNVCLLYLCICNMH
jgi:hypothetical protein